MYFYSSIIFNINYYFKKEETYIKFLSEKEVYNLLRNRYKKYKYFDEWFEIVKEILLSEEFQKRMLFKHHKNSVWDHSVDVSLRAFKSSKRYRADTKVCAIAGLLHDFYPLAWQYSKELEEYDPSYLERLKRKDSLFKKHGFTHAREATENYIKYYKEYEDKKISNSIKRHMFPLNIVPPRYKEGWIVTMADKKSSFKDSIHVIKGIMTNNKKEK